MADGPPSDCPWCGTELLTDERGAWCPSCLTYVDEMTDEQ